MGSGHVPLTQKSFKGIKVVFTASISEFKQRIRISTLSEANL